MAKYTAASLVAAPVLTKTLWTIQANTSGLRRFRILDILTWVDGTPGDTAVRITIGRFTAAGTNSGLTLNPNDPADGVPSATAGQLNTVEPTFGTASFFPIGYNQRSTVRWFAAPGEELVGPATNANGLAGNLAVGPTLSTGCTVVIDE